MATAVVGLAGVTGTVVVAAIGRRHAEHVARSSTAASIAIARDNRQSEALLSVLEIMSRTVMAVKNRSSLSDFVRAMPDDDDQARMNAQVGAFADNETQVAFVHYTLAVADIFAATRQSGPMSLEKPHLDGEVVNRFVEKYAQVTTLIRKQLEASYEPYDAIRRR